MSQPTMTVEIDDAIRQDPELLRDVEAETDYLRTLPKQVKLPDKVRWWQPTNISNYILLELDDEDGLGPVRHCLFDSMHRDKASRESAVRWAWLDLLEQRSRVAHERVAATIAELEAEGADGWQN